MDQIVRNACFVKKHKAELVQLVKMVVPLASQLLSQGMLQFETFSKIQAAKTSQEGMRELLKALDTGGDGVKSAFYCLLREHDPLLILDLEQSGGSCSETYKPSSPEVPVKRVKSRQSPQPQDATTESLLQPALETYKAKIHAEYKFVQEYNSLPGKSVLLDDRYTELSITHHHSQQAEHVLGGILSRGENLGQFLDTRAEEAHISINLGQLFQSDDRGGIPKAVILQGGSGYGKSFTAQKVMSDWATGRLYNERFLVVLFLKAQNMSATSGLKSVLDLFCSSQRFRPVVKEILLNSPDRVLFIIDGFDDLRVATEDCSMPPPGDAFTQAPVDATLKALLEGQVLPQCFLLITVRSTASDRLSKLLKRPLCYAEILGFSEHAVKDYIQRFFNDKHVSETVFGYVRLNPTLLVACHVPVVCWIVCTVYQGLIQSGLDMMRGLETTTSVFVEFLLTLMEHHCQDLSQPVPTLLRSLAQLAERGMLEQRVLFDDKIVSEVLSDPGHVPFLCKVLLEEKGSLETRYSFTHPGFQEFFCALHYALIEDEDELCEKLKNMLLSVDKGRSDKHSVIQFLCGLSNTEVAISLMEPLFMEAVTFSTAGICGQLKRWILDEMHSPGWGDQSKLFILLCLFELHDRDFARQAMGVWADITLDHTRMGKTDCWALLYCLQCCERVRNLSLLNCSMTAEKLRMLQAALSRCEQLGLEVEDLSGDHLGELILDVAGENIQKKLYLSVSNLSDSAGESLGMFLRLTKDAMRFTLTVRHHTHLAPERMPEATCSEKPHRPTLLLVEPRVPHPTFSGLTAPRPHTEPVVSYSIPAPPHTEPAVPHSIPAHPQIEPPTTRSIPAHPSMEPAVSHIILTLLQPEGMAKVNWAVFFQKLHKLRDLRDDTEDAEGHVEAMLSLLHSLSDCERLEVGLKRLTEAWANRILTLMEVSQSIIHIRLCAGLKGDGVLEEEAIQILRDSPKRPDCTLVLIGSKSEVEGERVQVNIQLMGRSFKEHILGKIRLQSPTEGPKQVKSEAACDKELKKCLPQEELDTTEDGPRVELSDEVHQDLVGAQWSCQSCAGIPDSTHWTLLEPSISMETGMFVYSLSSTAGSYECTVSGLRWVCDDDVTLQYHFSTKELFSAQLEMLQYRPVSPLMDIKVVSGELEEIHLPHSLCLGVSDHSKLKEAVRVLHGDDSGVSLETCELTRFHARLVRPSFSLKEVLVSLGVPVKTHCEVLIYQSYAGPLILNTFVVPKESTAKNTIEKEWKSLGIRIKKSPPKESFWINSNFQLTTSCQSEIDPDEISLTYDTAPTYFEVCIEQPGDKFKMMLKVAEQDRPIWTAAIRKGADYKQAMSPHSAQQTGASRSHRDRVFNARCELINRIGEASLRTLLDGLQKSTPDMPPVIKGRQRNQVMQANCVTEDQVTCLIDMVKKKGERACEIFISLLREVEPSLCDELGL